MKIMEPLLLLDNLYYRYGVTAGGLAGCSLVIERGSRNALIGVNGSGKTTLLLHIMGLLRPQKGSIEFDGQRLGYTRRELDQLRRRVGMVFQNPDHQLIATTVVEDVSFGPLNMGLDSATVVRRVEEALESVGMMHYRDYPLHHLSFGQKKRISIAGVLAMKPELLLLDEPMAGLDATLQEGFLSILETLSASGITIMLSTHDMDFAYRWADHLHVVDSGQCRASFKVDAIQHHSQDLLTWGQPVPSMLALSQELKQWGLLTDRVTPRSLEALLDQLKHHPNRPGGGDGCEGRVG